MFCFVLVGALFLAVLWWMATCFGLPSLVHQPTASRLYDRNGVIVSPHAVHPVDRAIHRAAKCTPFMVYGLTDEEGRSIIARAMYGPGYRAESHLGRKSGFMKLIAQQSGLVLTRDPNLKPQRVSVPGTGPENLTSTNCVTWGTPVIAIGR